MAKSTCAIYMLFNMVDEEIYIGSTTKGLATRLRWHKTAMPQGFIPKLYNHMGRVGLKNYRIAPIEYLPETSTRDELCAREQHWLDWLQPTLNTIKAQTNRVEYAHNQYLKNAAAIAARAAEKHQCECGGRYTNGQYSKHRRTAKHLRHAGKSGHRVGESQRPNLTSVRSPERHEA